MSGETEITPSAWTIDSLHAHIIKIINEMDKRYEQRDQARQEALAAALAAAEKAVQAALAAADRAVSKAELAAERRFENVNEFRGQLADQASTFMPRTEAAVELANLREKIDAQSVFISALTTRIDRQDGAKTGLRDGWGYLIGFAGLVLTLMTIAGLIFAVKGG